MNKPKIKSTSHPQKADTAKDIIHTDVDDDITSLISKITSSDKQIVAVTLPKNSLVLQSVVNMKLLKKAALRAKKKVALVTNDSSVQTLAGVAGVYVAETANSKPFIPTVNVGDVDTQPQDSVVKMDETDGVPPPDADIKDSPVPETDATDKVKEKNKKFKVPDFGAFQTKLTLGVIAFITLIVLWYIGFVVMPRANIEVVTNTENISLRDQLTLDYADDATVDIDSNTLPAQRETLEKTSEITQEATGEEDIGEKATGSATMNAQVCDSFSEPAPVPAGTGISSGGKTYITQQTVSFTPGSISGGCLNFTGGDTDIVAQESGDSYNVGSGTSFDVAGRSDVSAVGSASGGTSEVITVVSSEDIERAKQALGDGPRGEALQELTQTLNEQGLKVINQTLEVRDPEYTISSKEGDEASEFTIKQVREYRLSGYETDDLNTIVNATLEQELIERESNKNVSDNGIEGVEFSEQEDQLFFSTVATVGPQLDIEALQEELAGKRRGEIIDRLESIEGVQSATVNYSPMWITTTPKSANKIIINITTQ